MVAPKRKACRHSGPARRGHSEHPDRRRYGGGLCDGLRGLCALRISAARRGIHSARHRRAFDARGRSAPWPSARGPGRRRRLRDAAAGRVRQAGLLGALYLHRDRYCCRVCARARAFMAVACRHRHRARRVVDAARHGRIAGRSDRRARFQRACRLRPRRGLFGVRIVVRPGAKARRGRMGLDAVAVGLCAGHCPPRLRDRRRLGPLHGFHYPHRRDRRHRLAHRGGNRRRAGGGDPCDRGDGRLGGAAKPQQPDRAGRTCGARNRRSATLRLRLALSACGRLGGDVRRHRLFGPGAFDARARADLVGGMRGGACRSPC